MQGWPNYLMKNNSVEYVNNVMGRRFVECQRGGKFTEWVLAQKRVLGNTLVKYDVRERHILCVSTSLKLEEQFRNAIRLKHFFYRTEET